MSQIDNDVEIFTDCNLESFELAVKQNNEVILMNCDETLVNGFKIVARKTPPQASIQNSCTIKQ